MRNTLWEKTNYKSPLVYLIGTQIREYDITKANISVLLDSGFLSHDDYIYYFNLPKKDREIAIGKMKGINPEISKIEKEAIKNARRIFIESNNIEEAEILSIRNDSITVIGNKPIYNLKVSDHVEFRLDGIFTSFYNVNHIDYLYYYNPIDHNENISIKGLGDEAIYLHKEYMIDFLLELFLQTQMEGPRISLGLLQKFFSNYINENLPIEYYREINPISRYKLKSEFAMYSSVYLDFASKQDLIYIDTSFNAHILMKFNKIISSVYFNK